MQIDRRSGYRGGVETGTWRVTAAVSQADGFALPGGTARIMPKNIGHTDSTPRSGPVPSPLYVLWGALFILRHRILWKYAAAPFAISSIVMGSFCFLLYRSLTGWVNPPEAGEWYRQILAYLLLAVIVVLMMVVAAFVFSRVASAIAAPFNDLMSQKTEELAGGTIQDVPFSVFGLLRDSGRAITHSFRILGVYLGLMIPAVLLLLVPVVGTLLFSMVAAVLSAYMFAYEYLGYPMDRRRFSFAEKRGFIRARLRSAIGFGLGNLAVASIPLVNFLFLPAAVVGGTLLFLDLYRTDVSDPHDTEMSQV